METLIKILAVVIALGIFFLVGWMVVSAMDAVSYSTIYTTVEIQEKHTTSHIVPVSTGKTRIPVVHIDYILTDTNGTEWEVDYNAYNSCELNQKYKLELHKGSVSGKIRVAGIKPVK